MDTDFLIVGILIGLWLVTAIGGRAGADMAERKYGPLAHQSTFDVMAVAALIIVLAVGAAYWIMVTK